ncbi:MAG: beta-propeller domain-containing protein [bacterium]|nr:beta-propeller domain-containing protein [bacterium]
MPNQKLLDYIKQAKNSGTADEAIRQDLLGAGWPEADIKDALATYDVSGTQEGASSAQAPREYSGQVNRATIVPAVQSYETASSSVSMKLLLTGFGVAIVLAGGYATSAKFYLHTWPFSMAPQVSPSASADPSQSQTPGVSPVFQKAGLKKFASDEEFKSYILDAIEQQGFGMKSFLSAGRMVGATDALMPAAMPLSEGGGGGQAERVSQTNVQVQGIDEPDIVKTNGKEIYYSQQFSRYYPMPMIRETLEMPPTDVQGMPAPDAKMISPEIGMPIPYPTPAPAHTKIIKAFPPSELVTYAKIEKNGTLLVSKNVLVVLPQSHGQYYGYGYQKSEDIRGYDISNPSSPKEVWKLEFKESTGMVDARLYKDKLYVITRTGIAYDNPCPVVPMIVKGSPLSIPCFEIWRPVGPAPADVTFTAMAVNPADGNIEGRISVVGSSAQTILSMSPNALYLTHPLETDFVEIVYNFFNEKGKDLIPGEVLEKIRKLKDYDISQTSKMTELALILQRLESSDKDIRLKLENELQNRAKDYFKEHARDLSKTAVVKIDIAEFSVVASGEIPGQLLNQFSLDEYKGNLRVAITVEGNNSFGLGFGSGIESINDVYVLDGSLNIIGSVKDMGLGERIYSARFVEDRGYVVTFRQIDPFYVLDLSDPKNPKKAGELKIPGFSSYLHPLAPARVLGVGQEQSQVKVSLFDVSDPANPVEKAKYNLNEYWSGVSQTHHAFLADQKHKVFFLPGSRGGYVFSYDNDELKLVATLAEVQAERAVYLDDYLYILSPQRITVFDEKTWQKVKQLDLQ